MSVGDERDRGQSGDIGLLLVGSEPSIAHELEAGADRLTVATVPSAPAALDRLDDGEFDCVLSAQSLPYSTGRDFLSTVADRYPEIPTILTVPPDDIDLATDAISSEVTDCIPEDFGLHNPELLENRIDLLRSNNGQGVNRHERLIRETSDAIAIVDTGGIFDYLSPSSERVLGYSPVDLEGERGIDYVHPDDRDAVAGLFEDLVESPMMQASTEFRFEHADGSWVWLEARGRNLLHDPGIEGIVMSAREITDRKERERELRASEQRYRQLLETSPGPIFIYHQNGELEYVNEAGVELLDADTKDELVGTRSGAFTHPEDESTVSDRYERLVQDREPVPPVELRLQSVDGAAKHAIMASTPVTFGGEPAIQTVGMDITQAKQRERELQDERDRFTTLFENLPSPVVYGVLEDGKPIIRNVNSRFEEVFGYAADAIRGENLDDLIVPDDRQAEALALNEQIEHEGVIRDEVRRQSADGLRDFELRVVIDTDADPPEGYAIYTDITERKERERELERKTSRLDEFATVVSHDLRNPLSVAIGHLELAKQTCENPRLDEVQEAHRRMEDLIDDVLTIAREGQPVESMDRVDLESVVDESWQSVETGEATLHNEARNTVRADEGRLRQLLENLIRNATEHGPDGVTVTVADHERGFYVSDDGPGIPPEERDRVFDPGYSTTDDGTGFGLKIVEEIADVHGWELVVTESDGGGTRFEISGVDHT